MTKAFTTCIPISFDYLIFPNTKIVEFTNKTTEEEKNKCSYNVYYFKNFTFTMRIFQI